MVICLHEPELAGCRFYFPPPFIPRLCTLWRLIPNAMFHEGFTGWTPSLSLRFNGHFPGEPGLAGVYWSKGRWRWWWQMDHWSYKSCKAPVKSSPPTNQHPVSFTGWRPFLLPNQQCQSTEGKNITFHGHWTCLPQAHLWVFQLCLWPLIAPGYLEGGLPCLSSALWCQYPNSPSLTPINRKHSHWLHVLCILSSTLIYLFNPQLDTMQIRTHNIKTHNSKHANCKTSRQFVCLFAWCLTALSAQIGYIMP